MALVVLSVCPLALRGRRCRTSIPLALCLCGSRPRTEGLKGFSAPHCRYQLLSSVYVCSCNGTLFVCAPTLRGLRIVRQILFLIDWPGFGGVLSVIMTASPHSLEITALGLRSICPGFVCAPEKPFGVGGSPFNPAGGLAVSEFREGRLVPSLRGEKRFHILG